MKEKIDDVGGSLKNPMVQKINSHHPRPRRDFQIPGIQKLVS